MKRCRYSHVSPMPLRPLPSWRKSRGGKRLGLLMVPTLAALPMLIRTRITTMGTTRRSRTVFGSLLHHLGRPSRLNPSTPLGSRCEVSQPPHPRTLDVAPGTLRDRLVLLTELWKPCSKTPLYHHRQPVRASLLICLPNPSFPPERRTTTRLGIAQASRPNSLHVRTRVPS